MKFTAKKYFGSLSVIVSRCCCNKLLQFDSLKRHKCIILQLWKSKIQNGPSGLNSKHCMDAFLSGGSKEEYVFSTFLASRGYTFSFAHNFYSPSSKPAMTNWVFLLSYHSDTDIPASLVTMKEPLDDINSSWINQDKITILN